MIELYMRYDCPFCQKVIRAISETKMQENKDYTIIDAAVGTPGRQTVLDLGGKAMVPFLVDGPTRMYESDDIISYLKSKKTRD